VFASLLLTLVADINQLSGGMDHLKGHTFFKGIGMCSIRADILSAALWITGLQPFWERQA